MAKKTRRRAEAAGQERDHLGCMWGFMNMFTFRHGPLSHKLLFNHNNELDKSKCHYMDAQDTHVGEQGNVKITIIKPSVKKLIAEELLVDKEIKKQRESAEAGQLSDSELQGRRRKHHSCGNFSHILNTADIEETKKSHHHGSERSLDIDNMVEEFCSEMHRTSRAKNGMMNHKQEDYKEKLRELVKFIISQKQILTSKDLMEVFEILESDEDLFLKLLQDPEIQNSQNLSLFEKQSSSLADDKRSLFRRKDKTQEVTDGDRIFILKPRSASFSSSFMRHKERNTSHFFLSEIKRKLKQAIGEGYPKNVPTKDHFFLERMAKPSTSHKKKKHYDDDDDDDDDRKQRVSNIYIEAKKHLSEMLNNGDVEYSNSTSRQVQNSLGTILSLPDYLSPLENDVHMSKRETHVSLPNHAMTNDDDVPVCDLSKEFTNEDKISAAGSVDDVMIINEIGMVAEEASSTLVGDLPKAEAHDEQRDGGLISKQTSHEETQPPVSSSIASPSHCHDVHEWSSPISVLDPLFIEDDISPAKMRSQSDDEAQVQPWCIHFDDKEDSVKTMTSDKELVFKYVRDVLDAVVSDFEELYLKAQFSDQLLEPALISNIPFSPNQLCHDHELLFDCINEAIMELCCFPPWASFVAPRTRRVFSTVKSIVHEVQEAVYGHLLPLPLPHALDQIVRKDMAKPGNWLDIRCDIDCIGFDTSEQILEELLEDLTLNCLNNTQPLLRDSCKL